MISACFTEFITNDPSEIFIFLPVPFVLHWNIQISELFVKLSIKILLQLQHDAGDAFYYYMKALESMEIFLPILNFLMGSSTCVLAAYRRTLLLHLLQRPILLVTFQKMSSSSAIPVTRVPALALGCCVRVTSVVSRVVSMSGPAAQRLASSCEPPADWM